MCAVCCVARPRLRLRLLSNQMLINSPAKGREGVERWDHPLSSGGVSICRYESVQSNDHNNQIGSATMKALSVRVIDCSTDRVID